LPLLTKPEATLVRKLRPYDPLLEALCNERDHIRIQMSMAADRSEPDADRLAALTNRLKQLEADIAQRRKTANA